MKSYFWGFLLSLVLTIGAYFAVVERAFAPANLLILVAICSVAQIFLQFVCFLRLGREPISEGVKQQILHEPTQWNVIFFLFTVLIALVIVIGSLWIMANLDYRM